MQAKKCAPSTRPPPPQSWLARLSPIIGIVYPEYTRSNVMAWHGAVAPFRRTTPVVTTIGKPVKHDRQGSARFDLVTIYIVNTSTRRRHLPLGHPSPSLETTEGKTED